MMFETSFAMKKPLSFVTKSAHYDRFSRLSGGFL